MQINSWQKRVMFTVLESSCLNWYLEESQFHQKIMVLNGTLFIGYAPFTILIHNLKAFFS